MKIDRNPGILRKSTRWIVLLLGTSLLYISLSWWVVKRTEHAMRSDLLKEATIISKAVALARLKELSGTDADLESLHYRGLKALLTNSRTANTQYRFIYLLNRKPDNTITFIADSEPTDSSDYSPPGQIYDEAPESLQQVFNTAISDTEGPYPDRWGVWVSAFIPLTDSVNGKVVAVLGVYIDARSWNWEIASRAALPMGLLTVIVIGIFTLFGMTFRIEPAPKPILHKLLPLMTVILIFLLAISGTLLWHLQQQLLVEQTKSLSSNILLTLNFALKEKSILLASELQQLASDTNIRQALQNEDADKLQTILKPIFDAMKEANTATHMLIMSSDRVCLAQPHLPEMIGDQVNRWSVLEAERRLLPVTGLEISQLENLALRAVQPVYTDDTIIGYIELGLDIENILQNLELRPGDGLAVIIRKELLDQRSREAERTRSGHLPTWDLMPDSAGDDSSEGYLRDWFASQVDSLPSGERYENSEFQNVSDGSKFWRVFMPPLLDVSGSEIGNLLLIINMTNLRTDFIRVIKIGGTISGVLLLILLGIVYIVLLRADRGIQKHNAALRESELRFNQLAEQSRTLTWEVDSDGIFTYISPLATTMLGYHPDEVIGRFHFYDLHPEEGRDAFKAAAFAVFEKKVSFSNLINPIEMKNGEKIIVSTIGIPVLNPDGSLRGYQGNDTDVTERLRAEEALKESELFNRTLVETLPEYILIYSMEGKILYVNSAVSETLGYSQDEILGKHALSFIAEEYRDEAIARMVDRTKGIQGSDYEVDILTRDGSLRSAIVKGSAIRFYNNPAFLLILLDITERKRSESALIRSEARMRGITESAQDAIIMMDDRGAITFWNPSAELILGYSAEEAIGKTLHDLIVPAQYNKAHHAAFPIFQKTGQGNAIGKTRELTAVRKDLQEISVALSLSSVQIEGNWLAVGILRDISEQKRIQENLQETNRKLEVAMVQTKELALEAQKASVAKSEFLANMSHEIRTPMNGIIGMTGLLLDTELDDIQRRYVEIVYTSGESLLTLINDILDFSKIEAKKLDLEILEFDLQSMLDDFISTLAVRAQEKGLELLCRIDPKLPLFLKGDPGRLRQILNNLTGNAIKFTHKGEVVIQVDLLFETADDCELKFSVQDTGIGIPKEKIDLLFKQFTQVDASTTRQYGGTGLGLAISKQLAELMGGSAGVESKDGQGSVFWFTVRFGKQTQQQVEGQSSPVEVSLEGIRILLIDDNETNREILMMRLQSWKMRVDSCSGGTDALPMLLKAHEAGDAYEIVLTDMQMPEMNGETLCKIIRSDVRIQKTRLVLLTSLGLRGDAKKFETTGFDGYIAKPVRHRELFNVLSYLMTMSKDQQQKMSIITRHAAREKIQPFVGCNARILLAEDNITNQKVALGILAKLGLKANAVADGAEALDALAKIPYDIVLMDVQMPILDGIEATRRIRSLESNVMNHEIPIIAMTAHAMQGDRDRCIEAGMNDYVPKPIVTQVLAEVLQRWLPKKDKKEAIPTDTPSELDIILKEHTIAKEIQVDQIEIETVQSSRILDLVTLRERLMDDDDLIRSVLECFLEDIPVQITNLRESLSISDKDVARRIAHSIKGASANIAGEELSKIALKIERMCTIEEIDTAKTLLPELKIQFEALKTVIKQTLSSRLNSSP